jgi:predicted nucleotide-binding protein (sugar kinase/HSP70/actin superfamily)
VNGEKEAYGFLCGRDYETKKFMKKDAGRFELIRERKKLLKASGIALKAHHGRSPSIGIPATLHLVEDLFFWRHFFRELGIEAHTSEDFKDSLKTGKKIAGAEFCAPIDSMYGHVAYLAAKWDYVFLPVYLEARKKPEGNQRNYCYYTQYSASLAFQEGEEVKKKLVSPMLNFNKNGDHNVRILLVH